VLNVLKSHLEAQNKFIDESQLMGKKTINAVVQRLVDEVGSWRKSQSITLARAEAISNARNYISFIALLENLLNKRGPQGDQRVVSQSFYNMDATCCVINSKLDDEGNVMLYMPNNDGSNKEQHAFGKVKTTEQVFRIHVLFICNAEGALGPPIVFVACPSLQREQHVFIPLPGCNQLGQTNPLTDGVLVLGKGRALTADAC
jgi:hypothetical protein